METSRDIETKIREILLRQEVRSQTQLQEILHADGVSLNQSSISRAFKRLNVEKRAGVYSYGSSTGPVSSESFYEAASINLLNLEFSSPYMIVLKTPPGVASRAAYLIDIQEFIGVAGTIAGDDTVFVAVRNEADGVVVYRNIKSMFG